jgi:hypothetical protein
MRIITSSGQSKIDWIHEGICSVEEIHMLRTVVLLEARKEVPVMQTLLDSAPEVPDEIANTARVREEWQQEDIIRPPENDQISDPGPSISEVGHDREVFLAKLRTQLTNMRNTRKRGSSYYPLDKDSRPLTPIEISEMGPEVRKAKLVELHSWVKNKAGKPSRRADYIKKTGLKPLSTRWVETFKRKKGVKIVKERLVGKGFMEQNQGSLETSSPTATRTGHRMVMSISARKRWQLWSLDISAAFLKGFD